MSDKTFTDVKKFRNYCDQKSVPIVIGISCNERWVKVYKSDFFREFKDGHTFCNYDGETVEVSVIGGVGYVGYNTTSVEK